MKKLHYILLFVPLTLFGQSIISIEQNVPLELQAGWNMFGYSCYEPINVAIAFTSIEDKIVIVKDNSGNVYVPEFGFNGIGGLHLNRGYQIKLTEDITDFQFCSILVPLVEGCMDSEACNYNPNSNMADGSCEYPELGFDCSGDLVCYYPEDPVFLNWLQHNYPSYLVNSFCIDLESASSYSGSLIIGPDSTMQNIDGIQYFNNTTYLEINGLSQLIEIPDISGLTNLGALAIGNNDVLTTIPDLSDLTNLSTIGIGYNYSLEGLPNLSELSNLTFLDINDNYSLTILPDLSGLTSLDTLLIYNNSSLECALGYPEQLSIEDVWPPVCGEEVTYQVGGFAQGGIIFYLDETGQHGLVAALEDLPGTYEWGCYQQEVNGADATGIGTGYQNTLDIVNQQCSSENGGVVAAQAVLYTEINGYSDWYIPSKDELVEMYNTIGNAGSDGNVGNFINTFYWSSSEYINEFFAWVVNFNDGWTVNGDKYYSGRVRVIRAF